MYSTRTSPDIPLTREGRWLLHTPVVITKPSHKPWLGSGVLGATLVKDYKTNSSIAYTYTEILRPETSGLLSRIAYCTSYC